MRTLVTITLTLATALPAAAQPVTYTVMDLGPGFTSIAAINASGQTTGTISGQLFRASPTGQVTLLGSFGTNGGSGGGTAAINDLGQVVGSSFTSSSHFTAIGFVTTPTGGLSTAMTLGQVYSTTGVNNSGQAVGAAYFTGTSGPRHVFRTTPGGSADSSSDLGVLPGSNGDSIAQAINVTGQVTGYAFLPNGQYHGFRTTATGTLGTADDLGSLGGPASRGFGINASGQVVGQADTPIASHAFRSSPNGQPVSLQDLGSLAGPTGSSFAYGINALGVVVGHSDSAAGTVGFVYDTSMHNLNDLVPAGWDITGAVAINDSGWIAAYGAFNGGTHDGLVLIPVGVPEPSTLALVGLAGVYLVRKRLSNRRRMHNQLAES